MSWAEVKKINYNFMNEPLDFMQNVNDIMVFQEDAPILQEAMTSEWKEMVIRSKRLYGVQPIHQLVYNRLTNEDLDRMWNESGYLGEQINAFHGVTSYNDGNADDVISNMTSELYYGLDDKFRPAYQRYIDRQFKKTTGVGSWIKSVYNVDLNSYNTLNDIVTNENAWNLMLQNGPLMIALASSTYGMDLVAQSTVATERLADAIYYMGQNDVAIDIIGKFPELINQVTADATSMNWICANEEVVIKLLQNQNFATSALQSTTAMTCFGNSNVALAVLCNFYSKIQTTEDNLDIINGYLTQINSVLPNVYTGNTYTQEVLDTKQSIEDTIDSITEMTSMNAVTDNMVAAIIQNEVLITQMASNNNVMQVVAADSDQMVVFAASEVAMNAVAASEVAMNAVAASEVAMNAVAASEVAMNAVAASEVAMNAVAASEVAMNAVAASATAMSAIVKVQSACQAIDSKINTYASQLWSAINGSSLFTKSGVTDYDAGSHGAGSSGNHSGNISANNGIAFITKIYDDNTDPLGFNIKSKAGNTQLVNQSIEHREVTFNPYKVGLLGFSFTLGPEYPSEGHIYYITATAV